MVISVTTPRRSIRDTVLGGVLGGGRQLYQPLRCAFYDGAGGGCLPGDGLAAALSEATESVSFSGISSGGGGKKAAKNVLILMSDTGGGHRASAEALRDAFCFEFGDAYQVRPRPISCPPSLNPLLSEIIVSMWLSSKSLYDPRRLFLFIFNFVLLKIICC